MINPLRILTAWYTFAVIAFSGLLINFIQCIIYLISLLFGSYWKGVQINQCVSNQWWHVWTFLLTAWGGVPIYLSGDIAPKVHALLISNHGPALDFIASLSFTTAVGPGHVMSFMKDVLKFVPVLGWTHIFQGTIMLKRNWNRDRITLEKRMAQLNNSELEGPFWVGIYPEGTRMTAKNRASSHKFAAERGLPTFDHVLIPRVKGFQFLVNALPDIMRKMVDVTVGYHKGVVDHSFLWTGKFDIECIRVYTRVDDYSIVPKNKEECSAFLMERFKQKDDLLAHLQQHDEFPAAESRNLRMYTLAPAHFMQFFLYGLALASVCAFTLCEECALLTAAVLTGLNMYTVADGFYTHRANLERFKSSGSPSMKRVRAKKSD